MKLGKSGVNKIDHKALILFLAVHFLVWVVLPLLRSNVPMDSAEAIVWGGEWTLGTNKHPFLAGWLAEICYFIFGNPDVSTYIISQICILIGFIFIYKLARQFLDSGKSLLSVLLLEGTVYYSACSAEYNVNILSLAVVPAMVYFFHNALTTGKNKAWIWAGIFMGLALLTKYTNGIFLIAMGLFLIGTKQGRNQFKTMGLYVSGIVCLIVCTPHILWLIKHDFYVLDYLVSRASHNRYPFFVEHVIWPFKFIAAQVLAMSLTLIGFSLIYFKTPKSERKIGKVSSFVFYIGFVPYILWFLLSAILGIKLKSMWGFASAFMITIMLFELFPLMLHDRLKKWSVKLAYGIMGIWVAMTLVVFSFHTSERTNFPGREFAREMEIVWKQSHKTPLKYVGGDIWFASLVSTYLPDRPRVLIQMCLKTTPWIDMKDVMKKGAIVMSDNLYDYTVFKERVTGLPEPTIMPKKIKSLFGREKVIMIHYGILEPEEEGK